MGGAKSTVSRSPDQTKDYFMDLTFISLICSRIVILIITPSLLSCLQKSVAEWLESLT